MTTNAIHKQFGKKRVLLPVIHAPTAKHVMTSVTTAVESGVDGIFLINQGLPVPYLVQVMLPLIREKYPELWIGINALGYGVSGAVVLAAEYELRGFWTDDAGVDHHTQMQRDVAGEGYARARVATSWTGLHFGGTAFKTQTEVPLIDLAETAQAAARIMEVVTTSGRNTGVAAEMSKVVTMRVAIGNHALALASGVTVQNIHQFLPYVDAYIVATGIESEFGVLDPDLTRALADAIHSYV